ncbi:MBL fold metallo-hydrolase [soil metagenome]
MAIAIAVILVVLVVGVIIYLQQPQFGVLPKGERLSRVQASPNYRDGKFQNLSHTPQLTEGASYYSVMKEFVFGQNPRSKPAAMLPSQKTDLLSLDASQNILVWFGHSSYFMQVDGKTILVDPVFSGAASPVPASNKSYKGSDVYTVDDFPPIDYLFITHDHYDHLDYETVLKLRPKIKQVLTGLGTGAHLERWGYPASMITENDWNATTQLDGNFTVHTVPARHFSGRGLSPQQSLWVSFVLKTPTQTIFIGGDSGYDTHFATIGQQYGPFDWAILECGQYDKSWKYIHLMPEEVIQAGIDLQAKRILPVHWGKFSMGNHAWDDPILRAATAATANNMPLVTPLIGQPVDLGGSEVYEDWWKEVE